MPKRRKTITELARELRNNPTESEKILWEQLRKRRLDGHRFVLHTKKLAQVLNPVFRSIN